MVPWAEFERVRPNLAAAGRDLFYQWGVGLGFLATTSKQGSPRLHPICPSLTAEHLYAFLIPSPKLDDLPRDPRYALHSDLTPRNEDAFYVTGRMRVVESAPLQTELRRAYMAERPDMTSDLLAGQSAAEFLIKTCLVTRTTGHGDLNPRHTVWEAS